MPPGPIVGRDDRVLDAQAPQGVADLEGPRAAADDDERVVAGREGPLALAPPSVGAPQSAGLLLEHPVHDARMAHQELVEGRAGRG